MKNISKIILIASLFILASCADSKTFVKSDGTSFKAQPYGLINQENKIPGVSYKLSSGNLVLDVIFSETVVVPLILVCTELYEPDYYIEPVSENSEIIVDLV